MTQVLLLRGINVGGHGKLPMAQLRTILAELGAVNARTYIQSGNAVFEGDLQAETVAAAIEQVVGFRPAAMVLSARAFRNLMKSNPFAAAAEAAPKSVHAWIGTSPLPSLDPATEALAQNEQVSVAGQACYLHAPDGIGRSKLAAKLDRAFGQPVTARNWRTISALAAML